MHAAEEGEGEQSAARKARDARLEMALAANPLYRSWKQITAAIDATAEGIPRDALPQDPPDAFVFALPLDEGGSDLPEGIAELIRRSIAEHDPDILLPPAAPVTVELPAVATAPARKPAAIVETGAQEVKRTATFAAHRHPVAESEASVTFVRREPRPSLLPSAELPPDLGVNRKSVLFERLRGVAGMHEETPASYTVPSGDAKEADVVIVTPEDKQLQKLADERAGRVRRFVKALAGGKSPSSS